MGALTAIFGLAALNGFVLSAIIAAGRTNRAANCLLAALVALVSLRLCIYVIGFAGAYDAHPWLTFLPLDASAAYGPLTYLYVVALTRGLGNRWRWHLLPAVIQLLYQFACFCLPMPTKWNWYSEVHLHAIEPVATAAIVAQCCVYVAAAWGRHTGYQRWLDDRFGNREQWRLDWLRIMLASFALALASTVAALVWNFSVAPLDYGGRVPAMLGFAALAYVLGLLGWRYGSVAFPQETAEPVEPALRLDTPALRRVDHPALVREWRIKVEAAGWWREERLTVADLADRLGVSERSLSRTLSEGGAGNFNAFVNAMRVAGVQRGIEAGHDGDLLGLALDCGFASKASFNRAFRNVTGMTPSAWRREARNPPIR